MGDLLLMIIPYVYIKVHKGVSHPLLHVLTTTALGGGQSRGKRSGPTARRGQSLEQTPESRTVLLCCFKPPGPSGNDSWGSK